MSTAETLAKIAALTDILKAAHVLELHGLLKGGEKSFDIVKRYVEDNPDINALLARTG